MKDKLGQNFIDESKLFWQNYYPNRELTDDDVVDIFKNTTEYFSILIRWEKRQKERKHYEKTN